MTSAVLNPELYDTIVLAGVRSPGRVTLSGHDRKVNWDVQAGVGLNGASTTLKNVPPIEFTASFYLADEDEKAAWPAFAALIKSTLTRKKLPAPAKDATLLQTRKALAQAELDADRVATNQPVSFDTSNKEATIQIARDRLGTARLAYDQATKNALRAVSAVKPMNALDIFHPYLAENDITSVCEAVFGGGVDDGKGGVTYVVKFQEYKPAKAQTGSLLGSNTKPADPNQAALDELDRLTKQFAVTPWG